MKRQSTGMLLFFARHNDAFAAKVGFSRIPGALQIPGTVSKSGCSTFQNK